LENLKRLPNLSIREELQKYFDADRVMIHENYIEDCNEYRVFKNGEHIDFTITRLMAEEGPEMINQMLKLQKRRLDIVAAPTL
jgi:hypothetical protein